MLLRYKRPPITNYQRRILDSPARFTVTAAATKTGKTASHIIWLYEQAIQLEEGKNVWWVAPVFSQAEIAYKRMKQQVIPRLKANESKLTLTTAKGSVIHFKSAEKPDNLFGEDVYAAVFDEFTRAREDAWTALYTTLTATGGKCKLIGNVKGKKNWGYRLGEKARQGEPDHEFHKITCWDAVNAGILKREIVLQAQRDLPEHIFSELYLAEPIEDQSNPFGLKWIELCTQPLTNDTPEFFGIDLAKKRDWTVIIGLNAHGRCCHYERFQMDWASTIRRIVQTVGQKSAHIDSTGVGDPPVEEIQRSCHRVTGINYAAGHNTKQQLMEGLAVAVQSGDVTFPEQVADEMRNFEYEYTRTRVIYSAPEGLHDDGVNALALAVDCKNKNPKALWLIA